MNYVIVSLASDQTIPNVLFLKQFKEHTADYVFITTKRMKEDENINVVRNTCKAVGIDYIGVKEVLVNEKSLSEMEKVLKENFDNVEANFLVNATGGTKLMFLAVFEYFKKRNSVVYYKDSAESEFQPIHSFDIITDSVTSNQSPQLTLQEFLQAYGIEDNKEIPLTVPDNSITEKVFQFFLNNEDARKETECLTDYRDKNNLKKCKNRSDDESAFVKEKYEKIISDIGLLSFPSTFDDVTHNQIKYLTGGWLEEYTYTKVKNVLGLNSDSIYTGVKLQRGTEKSKKTDAEYDVTFVYNNTINIIECKSGLGKDKEEEKSIFNETILKLAARKSKFGLKPKMFLLTTVELYDMDDKLSKAKTLGIELINTDSLDDKGTFLNNSTERI